ncbi:MAG: glycosyltransferase [Magnetospirillum sp.]|nr:glycosyltransferase [Magnetospirillum sp.]
MSRTLLHVFPTFGVGGAQMRFARLANHFGRLYRHRVVSLDGSTACAAPHEPGLEDEVLTPPRRRGTLASLPPIRRLLDALAPDLMVTSNWGAMAWVLANFDRRVPHLHLEDGFNPDEAGGQLARRVWTRRLALRRSTVVLPSRTLHAIARHVWKLPERRLLYLPNGIDVARFARPADPAFAAALGLGAGAPVIGTVAALRPEKNVRRLIDAFALVLRRRPARLAIVGDGSERPALEAQVRRLGLAEAVIFTGACATPERLLPAFAVFALSSDTEQMPLSLLEAMAAGRPVAATAVGDIAEMVAAENRAQVVAKTPEALADALLSLLADPAAAAAIGAANARRTAADFAQERMFTAYRRLFDGT